MLSVAEIIKLKDGEKITVTWSGDNGPHEYVVDWPIFAVVPYAAQLTRYGGLYHVDPLILTLTDKFAINDVERVK